MEDTPEEYHMYPHCLIFGGRVDLAILIMEGKVKTVWCEKCVNGIPVPTQESDLVEVEVFSSGGTLDSFVKNCSKGRRVLEQIGISKE